MCIYIYIYLYLHVYIHAYIYICIASSPVAYFSVNNDRGLPAGEAP